MTAIARQFQVNQATIYHTAKRENICIKTLREQGASEQANPVYKCKYCGMQGERYLFRKDSSKCCRACHFHRQKSRAVKEIIEVDKSACEPCKFAPIQWRPEREKRAHHKGKMFLFLNNQNKKNDIL